MHLIVSGQSISIADNDMLVSGTIGEYTATFEFSSDWDGYAKTAVFEPVGGTPREVVLVDDACVIPWEVLQAECSLKIGCYGTNGDRRRPTIYTPGRLVHHGAKQASASVEPTPDVYDQILEQEKTLKGLVDQAVLFDIGQSLTVAQRLQARTNIGAAPVVGIRDAYELQAAVRAGVASSLLSVGDFFTVGRGGTDWLFQVAAFDYDVPVKAQYTHSMRLLMYPGFANVPFDA